MKTYIAFEKALNWLKNNTLESGGVKVTSSAEKAYPEVTGYLIPSLLSWGEKDLANDYGKWLMKIQNAKGYWVSPTDGHQYVFDTGQIVKGLLALSKSSNSRIYDRCIQKACKWMVSFVDNEGKVDVPDKMWWKGSVPEGVLLYSFSALREAGEFYNKKEWIVTADRVANHFIKDPNLVDFNCLSHFNAYILDGLIDLGYSDYARKGMEKVAKKQHRNGKVPAYRNVNWVCSTGLFQYSVLWYKLGDKKRGDAAFEYAKNLQNKSGGWFGSYGLFRKYFPNEEISWAIKYFLDALTIKLKIDFENMAPIFLEKIDKEDGRYVLVKKLITKRKPKSVLDVGCGKGRYLKNLIQDFEGISFYGSDLSSLVMQDLPDSIIKSEGSLLNLPYCNGKFDFVITAEALEHAVNVEGALRELTRVLAKGGLLLIIDKNKKNLGRMKLPDWEQWFDPDDLAQKLRKLGMKVETVESILYENKNDSLFSGWVATKI